MHVESNQYLTETTYQETKFQWYIPHLHYRQHNESPCKGRQSGSTNKHAENETFFPEIHTMMSLESTQVQLQVMLIANTCMRTNIHACTFIRMQGSVEQLRSFVHMQARQTHMHVITVTSQSQNHSQQLAVDQISRCRPTTTTPPPPSA